MFRTTALRRFGKRMLRVAPLLAIPTLYMAKQGYFQNLSSFNMSQAQPQNDGEFNLDEKKLADMLKMDMTPRIYHFYDSQNPLHEEYNSVIYQSIQVMKEQTKVEVISIDLNELNHKQCNEFVKIVTGKSIEQLKAKSKPRFFLKYNCSFKRISKESFRSTAQLVRNVLGRISFHKVESIHDLAEYLERYNTSIKSQTVLTYVPVKDGQDEQAAIKSYEEAMTIPLNFIRNETDHILIVTNKELADRLSLEEDTYYAYYTPSFLNDYENLVQQDLNIHHLQAYEGICRDSFKPKFDLIGSPEFLQELNSTYGMFTIDFMDQTFDEVFERTASTQFIMNPHFTDRFKDPHCEVPQCFIYCPETYMKKYIHEIKAAISEYSDAIEFVYTNDPREAGRFLYTKDYPDVMPYFCIVDKTKGIEVKEIGSELDALKTRYVEDIKEGQKFYYAKYHEPIFVSNLRSEVGKFLNKYFDGELNPVIQTEKMKQKTLVKKICGDNFRREILKNKDFQHCIVEIFKHDCPSCMYNGKVFNVFSRKQEKYGTLDELPCFRMAIDNKNPYIGTFFYSPMYVYIKKDGSNISEIKILDPPTKWTNFMKGLQDEVDGKLNAKLKDIRIKPQQQVMMHYGQHDLAPDFDVDFDLKDDQAKEKTT